MKIGKRKCCKFIQGFRNGLGFSKNEDYLCKALFKFGVERVLWIFTYDQKILIGEPNQDWILRDWAKDVQLMEGHTFNLMALIQKRGYKI